MPALVEPRFWNLFSGRSAVEVVAGVMLIAGSAGCGSRVAEQDVGDSGEAEAEAEDDEADLGTVCVDNSDCPVGYSCNYSNECEYYPPDDGWVPSYDCYADNECGDFGVCESGYCEHLYPPPPCASSATAMEIPIEGDGLALTFADVDADGTDELVVATETELLVLASSGAPPVVSPREPGAVTQMLGGSFDALPGEDLVLLIGNSTTHSYGSNGDGSFAAATSASTATAFVTGMIAGQFDGQPETDLLAWDLSGAYVVVDGAVAAFPGGLGADAGAAFSDSTGFYYLRRDNALSLHGPDLELVTSVSDLDAGPASIVAFRNALGSNIANIAHYDGWSRIQAHDASASDLGFVGEWSIAGLPSQVRAGDLDGDGHDELVFVEVSQTVIEFDPRGPSDCQDLPLAPAEGEPRGLAFGDYDGDGDDELAVLTATGQLLLIDGG